MSEKTIFEKIIDREIPADIVHQDQKCLAFRDIDPQAPVHILVVPKVRIARLAEAQANQGELLGHLLLTARAVAAAQNLDGGYRIVINNGPDGGESVPHLHVHVLGGRPMRWPPG